jgi:hypothetical protein
VLGTLLVDRILGRSRIRSTFVLVGLTALSVVANLACGDPNDPEPITGSLSGQVRNGGQFGPPLAGATITVAGRQGESGGDGRFEIDSIPAGIQSVTTTLEGFVTRTFDVEIRVGIVNLYDVELTPVQPAALTITTSSLPPATVDEVYEVTLEATGGTPPYVWGGGNQEAGLVVTDDGVVTGTPKYPAGSYVVGVSVRDVESHFRNRDLSVEVRATSGLRALGGTLDDGKVGVPYSDAVGAEAGAPPYTFELDGLPGGLEIDPASGIVSGTPVEGTGPQGEPTDLVLIVRDVVGASAFAPVSIGIVPAPVAIAADLPDGQVGVFYEADLIHSGGFGTFDTYTVISGTFPPGLGISGPESLFGSAVSGTPTLPGTYQFTLRLSLCDTNRPAECTPQIATRDYEVVIGGSTISIVTSTLPDAEVGSAYSVFLVQEGGAAPFQWELLSGSLPAGISLTPDGELTGTPTVAGDASFEVGVQDGVNQSATANLTLHVGP